VTCEPTILGLGRSCNLKITVHLAPEHEWDEHALSALSRGGKRYGVTSDGRAGGLRGDIGLAEQ